MNLALNQLQAAADSRSLLAHREQGIPAEFYHQLKGYYGSSQLKTALKSVGHFKAAVLDARLKSVSTKSQDFGTALHSACLENSIAHVAMTKAKDGRTKEYKDDLARAESEGKILLKEEEFEKLIGMYEAFNKDADVRWIMSRKETVEESFFWHDFQTNLGLKARTDIFGRGLIADYKTTAVGVDVESFQRVIANYEYDFSLAHYAAGTEQVTGQHSDCFLIAQEVEAPYAVQVFKVSDECIDRAEHRRRKVLTSLAEAFAKDEWPTYAPGIKLIDVPNWKIAKEVSA